MEDRPPAPGAEVEAPAPVEAAQVDAPAAETAKEQITTLENPQQPGLGLGGLVDRVLLARTARGVQKQMC